MGNKKADENVPEQDLSSTVESNFDDIEVETAESDSQDNFSSAGNSTDARQGNHNGTIINDQNSHNGPIISDLDGLYTYGQLAKMLNKPENNLRYLINTFRDYIPRLRSHLKQELNVPISSTRNKITSLLKALFPVEIAV